MEASALEPPLMQPHGPGRPRRAVPANEDAWQARLPSLAEIGSLWTNPSDPGGWHAYYATAVAAIADDQAAGSTRAEDEAAGLPAVAAAARKNRMPNAPALQGQCYCADAEGQDRV